MLAQKEDETYVEERFEVTEETPQFKNIHMKNITCSGAHQAIYLQGLPEMNLENISLENIKMEAEYGLTCIDAKGVILNNIDLKTVSPQLGATNHTFTFNGVNGKTLFHAYHTIASN
mgnify:CR=1 FL=1